MNFLEHILQHEILDIKPSESLRVRLYATDAEYVKRTDSAEIVAGWYTWLSVDMACVILVDCSGLSSLTQTLNLELVKTYRYPDTIAEVVVEKIDSDYWYLNTKITTPSGSILLATATGKFKVFKKDNI